MQRVIKRNVVTVVSLATLVGVAACDNPAEPAGDGPEVVPQEVRAARADSPFGESFRVFTRNMYLGGDTGPLFTLDFQNVPAVVQATNVFWAQVQATSVQERAEAIAAEIAMTDPHVVGLQEVAQYVLLDFDPTAPGGYSPDLTSVVDMAQLIMLSLAAEGLDYQLLGVQENTTGRLPLSIIDVPGIGQVPGQLLQFTLREATLVRSDLAGGAGYAQDNYQAAYDLGPLTLKRGWSRVSVDFRGEPHHVVNTHLESQSLEPVQLAQTDELIQHVTAGLQGVTIIMGDLNSDANAQEGAASWTPTYDRLRDAGFADAWLHSTSHAGRGYTCCHDPDLMNAMPSLDERIDLVLYRTDDPANAGAAIPGPVHMAILGDEDGDRTSGGLWPADHAALFAAFNTAPGITR